MSCIFQLILGVKSEQTDSLKVFRATFLRNCGAYTTVRMWTGVYGRRARCLALLMAVESSL